MLSFAFAFDGCPKQGKSSTASGQHVELLYYLYTLVVDKTGFSKASYNISNESAQESSFEMQSFKQILSSTKLSIIKFDKLKKVD